MGPLALRTPDRIWFIDPRTIDWIEADGDYVVVHVGASSHRIRETIGSIEQRVPTELLVRVSRSAIVNLSSVREMQRWFRGNFIVILRDGTRVTTGARYRDRLIRRI
jgi:two-component system LytT family response regulator